MISFAVPDMTCGHCVASITKAVQAADPGAVVQVSLAEHRVDIQPNQVQAEPLRLAIEAAGFTPQLQSAG
jgi:copper chaperone